MSGPRKFRKRPVVIEAMQYTADSCHAIHDWMNAPHERTKACGVIEITINTREGLMAAMPGDWIIKGVAGEFYPCKPEIFAATYDEEPGQGGGA